MTPQSTQCTNPVLVIDLEATCSNDGSVPPTEMEIIQVGAVLATSQAEILAEWTSHVRPVRTPDLTPFCMELTGITQSEVDQAPTLPLVMESFSAWISETGFAVTRWASWGAYDHHQFKQDFQFHGMDWQLPKEHFNMKALFAKQCGLKRRPALGTALTLLGLTFTGSPHHALDDAKNAARVLPFLCIDASKRTGQ